MANLTYLSIADNNLDTDDRIFMILIIKFKLNFKEDVF